MHLGRQVHEHLVYARLLHPLQLLRQRVLDQGQNLARLEPVRIQADLVRGHVLERVVVVRPALVALLPGRDVLADYLWTELLRLGRRDVAAQAECARRVIDGDEALPLLHGQRLVGGHAQANHLTLRVERIEVDVRDHAQRARGQEAGELGKMPERELRLSAAAAAGGGEGRRRDERLRGRHGKGLDVDEAARLIEWETWRG